MPEFKLNGSENYDFLRCDDFTQGYIEAMFFCECHPDNPELDGKGVVDLSPEAWDAILSDCAAFQRDNAPLLLRACNSIGYGYTEAGRDFWFTRNHHGVGFWDREIGGYGDELTESCQKQHKEVNLTLGDNGQLYLEG